MFKGHLIQIANGPDATFPRKKQNAKNIIDLRKISVVSQKPIYKKNIRL